MIPLGAGTAFAARANQFEPNAFIRVDRSGDVSLVIPQVEMGQGTYTSLAMVLAEELDAAWPSVRVEHAPPDDRYRNPVFGIQMTGNSNSARAFWTPLRKAGASARSMLVQAAARQWKVAPGACETAEGVVRHAGSGRSAAYGELAAAAARLPVPADPPLKDPATFRLIGRPLRRLDAAAKVNGSAVYGIDALPRGVKIATLAQSPVVGGRLASLDDGAARQVPGVRQIVALDDLVAVVGDHMWAARQGLEALKLTWDDGPNAEISTTEIWNRVRQASRRDGVVARDVGAVATLLQANDAFMADYELPLLAHACMEPLNCAVDVRKGSAEVWIGTQVIGRVQEAVAKGAGVPVERVTVHNHLIGGGFGRRLEADMAFTAARIASRVEGPLKVVWTREEDIRHDIYRPTYRDVMAARLNEGRIVAWKHKITGPSILARFLPPAFKDGVDVDGVDGAVDMPYDIPNLRVEFVREELPGVNTGFWRGVGPNNNVFAVESFMDELARQAGADPVAFRLAHLGRTPRLRAALELVAAKSNWGAPLPARTGRGVAVQPAFSSFTAAVVEAAVDPAGEVDIQRVTIAVDAGTPINPDTIVAQLQGGAIFGLTAALHGEVTLENGRVQQSNFHDYRILRINEVPVVEVHLIRSGEPPGGIGEAGTTIAVPALRNALYAATGVPLRRLPLDPTLLAVTTAGARPSKLEGAPR